jgi:hypothetical protein
MRKKKSRWRRVLLWSSLGLIILVIASLFVMNYAVDKILSSMSGMDTILEEVEAIDVKENSSLAGDEASSTPAVANKPSPSPAVMNKPSPTPSTNSEQDGQSDSSSQPTKPKPNPDTLDLTYKAEISTDKAKAIKEKATLVEKAKVTSLLVSNLSKDDIKLLSELASGVLNLEVKKKARALILEKLTEEQYDRLISIAQKYGLSEGKTYKEVIKEE